MPNNLAVSSDDRHLSETTPPHGLYIFILPGARKTAATMWLSSDQRHISLRAITLLALVVAISGHANGSQTDSNWPTNHDPTITTPKTPPPPTTAQPTCESRTVNYITHTLPQQCLASSPPTTPTGDSAPVSRTPLTTAQPPAQPSAEAAAAPQQEEEEEEEHELDSDGNDLSTGAFMSFEEWKEMMLKKSGQEALEARPRKDGRGEAYPGGDFDTLGEEGEIALDFDAYSDKISEIASAGKPTRRDREKKEEVVEKVSYDEGLAQIYRSKDAGKTCKERFSYSSFDAGATVLKTSHGAKNPKAILAENKDSYMLLECSMENKFFIVELSDDILVDTVVLANFEFFSSMIRQFRVSVSDRYPVKLEKWKILGEFQARNSRDIQPFLVENPQIWARYLRIEVLSHYGNEYYCPLSLLRVHGTRMLDSWKEADPSEIEGDSEAEDETNKAVPEQPQEIVEPTEAVVVEEAEVSRPAQVENHTAAAEQSDFIAYWDKSYFERMYQPRSTCGPAESPAEPSRTYPRVEEGSEVPAKQQQREAWEQTTHATNASFSFQSSAEDLATEFARSVSSMSSSSNAENATDIAANSASSVASEPSRLTPSPGSSTFVPPVAVKSSNMASYRNKTSASTSIKPPSSKLSISKPASGAASQTASRNRTSTPTTSVSASPTVQDSFFKQLTKRLQTLESNTTLSLQYIESQSKFLQEALSKLERRQVAKVDLFLDTLNKTVLSELRDVRTQYDQIWQSTVIALETQREQSERELVALSARLGVLADEVVFQKRMAIVQSILLLGCLVLVIFSRTGIAGAGMEALYYPSQFLGSSSRMASPLYPSTPKALGKLGIGLGQVQRTSTSLRKSIERSGDVDGNSDREMTSNRIPEERSPTLESAAAPRRSTTPHTLPRDSEPRRRRPSPSVRAVSDLDIGYDSEPAMETHPDYFAPQVRQDREDSERDRGGEEQTDRDTDDEDTKYTDISAQDAERQSTTSSEGTGVEYSSRRAARASMSSDPDPE
ncbi:UNC-like C-terminal-domain-containing protein [Pseudomassariella vexata]|uniref:UNC-like C-terminal-domain-containing protein n=1 Tax=Pseudomassariella vexata TaxID=1141098 RepID=A0A1Y2DWF9_9PEZI|nr:UNC-like C-terminal-domain-containing protein [Pseudomassariella vexata]ORY63587.1 UNC-like C-terminal-domain-containing protein [Pseudomassariella vexata]